MNDFICQLPAEWRFTIQIVSTQLDAPFTLYVFTGYRLGPQRLKWLELGFKATYSINAPFLRHLWPIKYWIKLYILLISKWGHRSLLRCNIQKTSKVPCVWVAKLPLSCFLNARKKAPDRSPHASDCYATSKFFLLKEKRDILKSFFHHFSRKKPKGESALQISPSPTELRCGRTLSRYLCSPIVCKSLVSSQQGRKKKIMKSW